MAKFDKDAWIRSALAAGRILPNRDGTITRVDIYGQRYDQPISIHKKSGRRYFNLTFEGITKSVLLNRVIALAFLPNPFGLPEVNHKDGDKGHNAVDNLEWSARADQEKHAFKTNLKTGRGSSNSQAVLTAVDVFWIRASAETAEKLAKFFKVSKRTILDVQARRTWSHI